MIYFVFIRILGGLIFTGLLTTAPQAVAADRPTPPPGDTLLISGGTVVDPFTGSAQTKHVLIKNGQVVSVTTQIPDSKYDRRIDARGKWLSPGLTDAHVHFFQSGGLYTRPDFIDLRNHVPYEDEVASIKADIAKTFARYLKAGITHTVDMGGPDWNFSLKEVARTQIDAPEVVASGPLISSYLPPALDITEPPIIRMDDPRSAVNEVQRQVAGGADFIKIWVIASPPERLKGFLPVLKAVIAEAHRLGKKVAAHATELETARIVIEAGADILVHSIVDTEVDDEMIDLLKNKKIIYIPTLAVTEGSHELYTGDFHFSKDEFAIADPLIAGSLFKAKILPDVAEQSDKWKNLYAPRLQERMVIAKRNLLTLYRAGVTIATGSDAGNIATFHGAGLLREFELMAEAGLLPAEVLYTATVGASSLPGMKRTGRLIAGELADIVILNTNPLTTLIHAAAIETVVWKGNVLKVSDILPDDAQAVVQKQVNAYNARDLELFLSTYGPEAVLYTGMNKIRMRYEEMKERYGNLFATNLNLYADIESRAAGEDFVADREVVYGLRQGEIVKALAVYEVESGLIRKVWFLP